jgi:hypothetical protein
MTSPSTARPAPGHSAEIIVFPFRDRMAAKALPEQKFAMMEAIARRHPTPAGSGWYHEAAIAASSDDQDD